MHGPNFLNYDVHSWPSYELLSIAPEMRNKIVNLNIHIDDKNDLELIEINRYSNFNKLMKITYYVCKFFCNVTKNNPYEQAMNYWICKAQNKYFSNEIKFLNIKDKKENVPMLVSNLNLFLDEKGLLRSKGRISKCIKYDYNIHNLIVLPKCQNFTKLLVLNCHVNVSQMGLGITLNYVRMNGFWIPQGRSLIKKVINECIT